MKTSQIPEDLCFRASNNLLEYLASKILPWVNMLAGHLKTGDYALSMTDRCTSAGWLRKTNFQEIIGEDVEPVQSKVCIVTARHHTTLFLKEGIKKYSQWFSGEDNDVADALLRNFD
jgi:hypothetical protein